MKISSSISELFWNHTDRRTDRQTNECQPSHDLFGERYSKENTCFSNKDIDIHRKKKKKPKYKNYLAESPNWEVNWTVYSDHKAKSIQPNRREKQNWHSRPEWAQLWSVSPAQFKIPAHSGWLHLKFEPIINWKMMKITAEEIRSRGAFASFACLNLHRSKHAAPFWIDLLHMVFCPVCCQGKTLYLWSTSWVVFLLSFFFFFFFTDVSKFQSSISSEPSFKFLVSLVGKYQLLWSKQS